MTQDELFKTEEPAGTPNYNPIEKEMENATVTLVIPEKTEIEVKEQSKPIVELAANLVVSNPEQQIVASEHLKEIKGEIKKAKEKLTPICDAAHKAWKANTELRKELIAPFEEAENIIKAKLVEFMDIEEEKARKKQAEIEAAARHEEEKKRKELEERAEKWKEKGNEEKAEMLLDESENVTVAPPVVKAEVAKIKGVSTSQIWTFEITDMNLVPKEYMLVNEAALRALAKTTKGNVKIPGVRFYSERNISAKA